MLTYEQLHAAMPRVPETLLAEYSGPLNWTFQEFEINTPVRAAPFLAQIGHESLDFRFMEEIWGPTEVQKTYERPLVNGVPASPIYGAPPGTRLPKWQQLGNTEPGDGYRFRGRGPIEVTGRGNYGKAGFKLKLDLLAHPELLLVPINGFRASGLFWHDHGLNELADQGSEEAFREITRKVNGAYTDLDRRRLRWMIAKKALGL